MIFPPCGESRKTEDEIEVTPEMIRAGQSAYLDLVGDVGSRELVLAVFLAMLRTAPATRGGFPGSIGTTGVLDPDDPRRPKCDGRRRLPPPGR